MSINSQEFVRYASELFEINKNHDDREIQLRTAINRAYYGAFLTARDRAGINDKSGKVHIRVAKHYRDSGNGVVGEKLNLLKRLRQKADYRPDAHVSVEDAEESCDTAQRILDELV